MSSHSRFLELAAAQLDFELTTAEAVELQGHLATCTVCPSDVRGLRADADLLADLPVLYMATRREAIVFDRVFGAPRAASAVRRVAITALLALLALGLALIGAEVIRRISNDRLITYVVPTPVASIRSSTPPSAKPTAAPVAAELQDWWFGPHKELAGLPGGSGSLLEIGPIDVGIYALDGRTDVEAISEPPLLAAPASTSSGALRLLGVGDPLKSCDATSSGTYPYTLSPTGQTLTIAAGSDTCATRAAAIPGTWWRADCPGRTDLTKPPQELLLCLGPLDAGSYSPEYLGALQPTRIGGFGDMTFSVPAGWSNYIDGGGVFGLTVDTSVRTIWPDGPFPSMSVDVMPDVGVRQPDQLCQSRASEYGRNSVAEMLDRLATLPGLTVSPRTSMTINGLKASFVDMSLDESTVVVCTRGSVNPRRWPDPAVDYFYGDLGSIDGHHRQRLILLDTGLTSDFGTEPIAGPVTIGIRIDVEEALDFAAEVARAMPVIATFQFATK